MCRERAAENSTEPHAVLLVRAESAKDTRTQKTTTRMQVCAAGVGFIHAQNPKREETVNIARCKFLKQNDGFTGNSQYYSLCICVCLNLP